MFLNNALIIVLSFIFFIVVFLTQFHLNFNKEYEAIYEHQSVQVEQQLQNKQTFNWSDKEMAEIFSYSLHQSGYHIYLIDEVGNKLYESNDATDAQLLPLTDDVLGKIKAGEKVSEARFENGELYYKIVATLPTNIVDVDEPIMIMVFHNLHHEYVQIFWMILFTLMMAILFSGVFLWFMSKRITAPLREMSDIARLFAKGDFSKQVQYERQDEIGQLAKSFTYMADELNNLEKTRRQFISNVSHELRSPLTSIKGFIIAFIDGTIPEHKHDYYFGLMKTETERMIKLVNDTLDMNRLDEGNDTIFRKNYNLTEQITDIINKLEPQCEEKQLQIKLFSNKAFIVYADKERIEQVMINLLQNAIQFSHENSFIKITLTPDGNNVKITIQDNGIGMKDEQTDLIWRRFYKVDEARSHKTGAGLGLAIVKSILDLHETDIEVQTKLGDGTVFSFHLPLG